MAAGIAVALVHFQKGAGRAIDEGGRLAAAAPAQADQAGRFARSLSVGQGAQLGLGRARGDGGQGVGQNPADLFLHLGAEASVIEMGGKVTEGIEVVHGVFLAQAARYWA